MYDYSRPELPFGRLWRFYREKVERSLLEGTHTTKPVKAGGREAVQLADMALTDWMASRRCFSFWSFLTTAPVNGQIK